MAFTGQLGTSDSYLSNIELGVEGGESLPVFAFDGTGTATWTSSVTTTFNVRTTQHPVEVVSEGTLGATVTQVAIEAVSGGTGGGEVTQAAIEVVTSTLPRVVADGIGAGAFVGGARVPFTSAGTSPTNFEGSYVYTGPATWAATGSGDFKAITGGSQWTCAGVGTFTVDPVIFFRSSQEVVESLQQKLYSTRSSQLAVDYVTQKLYTIRGSQEVVEHVQTKLYTLASSQHIVEIITRRVAGEASWTFLGSSITTGSAEASGTFAE